MKINDYDLDIVERELNVWPTVHQATERVDNREAAISAGFGDDMETTTLFKLTL
jgi:hypothetical protein